MKHSNKPRFQGTATVPKERFKVDLYIEKKCDDVCDLWYKKRSKRKYLLRNKSYEDCHNEAMSYINGTFEKWIEEN